jgi:hypothetical protein
MSIRKIISGVGLAVVCATTLALGVHAGTLPSKVCFSVANPGSDGMPTYFDASLAGVGKFDAWCISPDMQIVYGPTYTALVLSPTEAAGYVLNPQNFDLVAWIINQDLVGKPSQAGGDFTMGDVQNAIWLLIDDSLSVDQGPSDSDRVQEIIAAALLHGEGYEAECGDRDIVVLVPVATGCDLNTTSTELISQAIVIEVPVPCGPGTGTPGYWINHPDAWPVNQIEIGGITYTKEAAIAMMKLPVAKDKRLTMFPALVCAKLNVLIGNDSTCVDTTIGSADIWWAMFNGSPVAGNSEAWKLGEPLYRTLDNYNNGLLCAPHRD